MSAEDYPISNAPTEAILGMLLLSLMKKDKAVYIDIYPIDPANPSEYTYEYTETALNNATNMADFRQGIE